MILDLTQLNSERTPSYARLDLRVDRRFVIRGTWLSMFFEVQNVTTIKGVDVDAAITIRRLTVDDAHLAQQTFQVMADVFDESGGGLSSGYVASLLALPGFWAYAAVQKGAPVGGITAHALPMTRNESTELFIYDLAVLRATVSPHGGIVLSQRGAP